jgi:hypothetical protein
MKMKRLTEIDEYGNADIIGMEDETWQMGLSFNDMNKMTLVLNRLHRLEKLYEHHKQPDPITGLVPCGCGGKAKLYHRHSTILPKQILWVVQCVKFGKCGISTPDCTRKQDAIALWNLAMSGQTAEQKPVKTRNETPPKPGVTVQVSDNPGCKL